MRKGVFITGLTAVTSLLRVSQPRLLVHATTVIMVLARKLWRRLWISSPSVLRRWLWVSSLWMVRSPSLARVGIEQLRKQNPKPFCFNAPSDAGKKKPRQGLAGAFSLQGLKTRDYPAHAATLTAIRIECKLAF